MSEPPEGHRRARQWVEKAEHDLINAAHTLTLGANCPFDTVCFHAQQCAEKYIKAWLVVQAVDFLRTHDLIVLMRHAEAAGLTGLDIETLLPLNRYSVEARYPGDWDPIDRAEAERAVGHARAVRDAVRSALPPDVMVE